MANGMMPNCCRCKQPFACNAERAVLKQLQHTAVLEEEASHLLLPSHAEASARNHQQHHSDEEIQHSCRLLQQCLNLRQQALQPQNELLGRTFHRLTAGEGMQPGADH